MYAEVCSRGKASGVLAAALSIVMAAGASGCTASNSDMYEDESRIRQSVHRAEDDKGKVSEIVVHHIWHSCATVTVLYRDKANKSVVAIKQDEFWKVHYPQRKAADGGEINTEESCLALLSEGH
ncbi:hypothetical protein SAMN05421595_2734 [Austwickia chelonae]|uniref:Lipoprotein n=1 Tax=Austwickia chelonae NBRC 105200 TaxID=1184607 RepID=K6VSZ6_9MICO|nr:hypothetical protein [Austwickia chelonae]GAB78465.1 hypothetical protein AUCHE_09_00700 [Austwickia chelonae NBRC 105200]SEW39834.1 hypothetical protein SAMN05421595_2734 [Austwickia chelonae]